jgi:hypothetical protein
MATASETMIPPQLKRKISPALLMFAGRNGRAPRIVGVGISAWMLYGPATVHPDHNGFLYLLAPWIIPSVVAIFYMLIPFRPYRGVVWERNMQEADTNDPAVVRLAELYKSGEARRHLLHENLKLSGILFAILGTAAILLRDSLNWTLPSSQNQFLLRPGHWFWIGIIGCFIGCYVALSAAYIGWGLTTWATREVPEDDQPQSLNLQRLREDIREGLENGPSTVFDPKEIKRAAGEKKSEKGKR